MSALVNAPVNQRFSGQVVLVAGGTGGLGSAVSVAFLDEGATVAVTCREPYKSSRLCVPPASSLASRLGETMPSMLLPKAPFVSLWPSLSPSTSVWTP